MTASEDDSILTIPQGRSHLGVLRLVLAGIGHRNGLSPSEVDDLKLVSQEVCSNIVEEDQEGNIIIQWSYNQEPAALLMNFNLDNNNSSRFVLSGLDLSFVTALVDNFELSQDGKNISFRLECLNDINYGKPDNE